MLHRLILALVVATLGGCAARTLDDLSTSYERLVAQQQQLPPATVRQQGDPVAPVPGNLGSSFLAVGRGALDAAGAQGVDQQIRISLYGVAARSAHFVLVEEASTGRPVEVIETMSAPGTPAATRPGASGAVVMRRAVQEGTRLCGSDGAAGPRPPRDCAYLNMAESIAQLAILAEPWIHRRGLGVGATDGEKTELVTALAKAPDTEFNSAVSAYWNRTGTALGASPGNTPSGAAGGDTGFSFASFARTNDIRAYCIVSQRFALALSLPAGEQIPGIDRAGLASARTRMRDQVNARHGADAAKCT